MEHLQSGGSQSNTESGFDWGHLKIVFAAVVLLLGASWLRSPGLFSFKGSAQAISDSQIPRYYAYVPPAELSQPMVAGANTNPGPSIIGEDGSINPIADVGQVLGASTENVQLSLDEIQVKEVPDSDQAIKQYLDSAQNIESGYINNADFEAALLSGKQEQVDSQAQKLLDIKNNLEALSVPHSLVKLQKLKIAQYTSGINILKNFTQADNNPELVGQYLDQFLKSQQDLDTENVAVAQKYGSLTIPTENAAQ